MKFEVIDKANVMILGVGDPIISSLNLIRKEEQEMYKNNLKYSFISIGSAGINNYLGRVEFKKSLKTNYYNDISYLEIGRKITNGLGTFGKIDVALKAFYEDEKEIDSFLNEQLKNIDLVIVISALGGGTGTIITPLINKKIRNRGIPLINVISTPFEWEGKKRTEFVNKHLPQFYETSDKTILINNEKIMQECKSIMRDFLLKDAECCKIVKLIYESFLCLEMDNKISKEEYLSIIKNKSMEFKYIDTF